MGCYFLTASQSPNLASHERFFAANTRAALVLDERIKCWAREEGLNVCPAPLEPRSRRPLPSRTHPPLCKSGTFYFAKKRNFLLCVDTRSGVVVSQFDFHKPTMMPTSMPGMHTKIALIKAIRSHLNEPRIMGRGPTSLTGSRQGRDSALHGAWMVTGYETDVVKRQQQPG